MKVKSPAPDPAVGQAAASQADVARRQVELAEREYADSKARLDEFMPLIRQQIDLSIQEQGKYLERADAQWEDYEKVWRPTELKFAEAAQSYATPGRQEQEAQRAVGDVSQRFDVARQEQRRALEASGNVPTGPQALALENAMRIEQAKAEGGAADTARRAVEDRGLMLLESAARFGRNMPATGLAASGMAGQQGGAVQGAVGQSQAMAMQPGVTASQMYSGAVGSYGAAANTYLGDFEARRRAQADKLGFIGDIIGAGANLAGMSGWFKSSRESKHVGRKVGLEEAVAAVERSPASEWAYKDDPQQTQHIGPMAEDFAAATGRGDGKTISVADMLGLHHAAIAGVAKKVKALEMARKG